MNKYSWSTMKLSLHDVDAPINTWNRIVKLVSKMPERMQLQTSCWRRMCQKRCSRISGENTYVCRCRNYRRIGDGIHILQSYFLSSIECEKKSIKIPYAMHLHEHWAWRSVRSFFFHRRFDRKKWNEWEWIQCYGTQANGINFRKKLLQTDRTYDDVVVAIKWAYNLCHCEQSTLDRDRMLALAIFVVHLSTQFYR